jgi:hypothetical protein
VINVVSRFEEAKMNRDVSMDAALTANSSESKGESRSFTLWPVLLVVLIVASVVLTLDASLTPDQRIAVFLQSGIYP